MNRKFNWSKSKFIEKKCEDTIMEICIYTDGYIYAVVNHLQDRCREFESKELLDRWIKSYIKE